MIIVDNMFNMKWSMNLPMSIIDAYNIKATVKKLLHLFGKFIILKAL